MFDNLQSKWDRDEAIRRMLLRRGLNLTSYDKAGTPLYPMPFVNVMLIGWENEIAYRIATGWVLLTKWVKAKRHLKVIALK